MRNSNRKGGHEPPAQRQETDREYQADAGVLPRGPLSEATAAPIWENPLQHGFTAKHVVLNFETSPSFHELRASVIMEYLPKTPERALHGRPGSPKLLARLE